MLKCKTKYYTICYVLQIDLGGNIKPSKNAHQILQNSIKFGTILV